MRVAFGLQGAAVVLMVIWRMVDFEYSLLCPVGDIRNPKYGQLEINVCGDSVEIKIIHLFH